MMTHQPAVLQINRRAPVIATGEIEIRSSPELVWDLMADIDRWPRWNPDVTSASLNGDLLPGSTFRWKAGPGIIKSTLLRVQRPSVLAWTGKTLGIQAVHIWWVQAQDASTLVRTEESWDGLPVQILPGMMRTTLDRSILQGLRYLKVEAERRSQ